MFRLTFSVVFLLIASSIPSWGDLPPTAMDAPSYGSWEGVDVNNLNSIKEGVEYTIYLDFDGHKTTGTGWNSNFNDNKEIETPKFSIGTDAETRQAIGKIWASVAEDYAPFNVNVTTVEPPSGTKSIRVCIGGNSEWYSGVDREVGGVAYPGTFGSDTPAFVFPDHLSHNPKNIAEAVSHEVGHTLGIGYHYGLGTGEPINPDTGKPYTPEDARKPSVNDVNTPYYYGDMDNKWAPIMGAGYRNEVTQWSDGDYPNNTSYASKGNVVGDYVKTTPGDGEGDLEIIDNTLGYRQDDYKGESDYINVTLETITNLFDSATGFDSETGKYFNTGIIETRNDVDMFQFTLGNVDDFVLQVVSGVWQVGEDLFSTAANLDILAKLFRVGFEGNLLEGLEGLAEYGNPLDNMNTDEIRLSELADLFGFELAGTYLLSIEGTGRDGYYSDYGSLGTYAATWEIRRSEGEPPTPVTPEPTTLIMVGLGLAGLAAARRRK